VGSNGRTYTVPVAQLPSARGDGLPVTSLIELAAGTRLVAYVAGEPALPLLLATSAGYGFACQLGDLVGRNKGGKQFINVDDGGVPLRPVRVDPAGDSRIACASEAGRLLVFEAGEIKAQPGGGRGVILMGLDEGETMRAAQPFGKAGLLVSGTAPRTGKPTQLALTRAELAPYVGHRARKGTLLKTRMKIERIERIVAA
jgi:topoisomerase-4 subunit A